MLEAFRDGGPRKREGGGGRWGWVLAAEEGERVDIVEFYVIDVGSGSVGVDTGFKESFLSYLSVPQPMTASPL